MEYSGGEIIDWAHSSMYLKMENDDKWEIPWFHWSNNNEIPLIIIPFFVLIETN